MLAIFCLVSLKLFKIKISSVKPDIVFGVIDNGILALMAVIGGRSRRSVMGGVVGNATTDGIAGCLRVIGPRYLFLQTKEQFSVLRWVKWQGVFWGLDRY